jgi:cytochrome P450
VGNFPHLLKEGGFHRTLQSLHKEYGPILTLWYASKLTIVLGNPRLVQQTHREQSEKFQHRTHTDFARLSLKADKDGGKNVALAGGKYWVKSRKVFVQELMNRRFLEGVCVSKIMQEIWSAMDAMKALNGAPFDPHEHLQRLSCNIVYRLTYGIRFNASDVGNKNSDWGQLCDVINGIMSVGGQNVKANYSPLLKFLENLTTKGRALNRRRRDIIDVRDSILRRLLQEHKDTIVPEKPRDFLDVLLTRKDKDDLSDTEVMYIAWEFITAGTDTTSATMHWLVLLLANHPEVQKRAQKEIDTHCKGRPVTIEDQDKLPYVNACVKECMRWMPAVPLMVPYAASVDATVELDGCKYEIKQGTQVIVNGFNMHRDPDLWEDADVFNPERFMTGPDADLELKGADAPNDVHHLKFMPLGTGRRACAGYLLAKLELFLQGATLMQCFDWVPPEGDEVPLKEVFGIAVSAAHTNVKAHWRADCGVDLAATVATLGAQA